MEFRKPMILCLSQMVAVACLPLLRTGVSRRARRQFFIGSKFLLERSSWLTIGDVDIRFIEKFKEKGRSKK